MSSEETEGRVDEITITITDSNASYKSSLPPQEIIFWLDLMKHMILNGIVQGDLPEPIPNPPEPV